ncbi:MULTISPECIES: flavin-containing monooxygenase [unclassified Sphingomonas]|uniref:flavin-containing monooxygenase n=1 Tax=Novosphingobium rhizosphaerae TaxID=1551649 RepID=UPI0015C818F4
MTNTPRPPDLDVAIIGAGISGISMAAHIARDCPGRSFALLERRSAVGGTWDLFRYPGVRSDSDMHTLGFGFAPWRGADAIADGAAIRDYLNEVVSLHGLARHIRTGTRVTAADWDSAGARWHLTLVDEAGRADRLSARFLVLAAGYYDHDAAHDPALPGEADFAGRIVHPQFWPQDLYVAGKQVAVIGSGATAATLVPALAARGAQVTMLQRTPTWFIASPRRDRLAHALHRMLPARLAAALVRARNIRLNAWFYNRARRAPDKVGAWLKRRAALALGPAWDEAAFAPPYGPWQQRLCLVPDGDLFAAIRSGRARVVTGTIAKVAPAGLALADGQHLAADVIVKATGLKLAVAGKIALSKDGAAINLAEHFHYKDCMLSNLPNLVQVFGYLNASWTLRADLVAAFTVRILDHMARTAKQVATPVLPADHGLTIDDTLAFSSGYLQRGWAIMPRSSTERRWRLNHDYLADRAFLRRDRLEDGVLRFDRAPAALAPAPDCVIDTPR